MGRRTLPLPYSTGHFMESVKTDLIIGELVNESTVENSPKYKEKTHIDRVSLVKDESDRLNKWLTQIKNSTKGFLDLTRSDLVNFLIKSHADELTAKEIKNIRLSHYSLIKHLNWITPQLKKAFEENDVEQVKALQTELRGLELGVIQNAQKKANSLEQCNQITTKKQRAKKSETKIAQDKIENS